MHIYAVLIKSFISPSLTGKEHWIIPQESLTSGDTFWAHVVRTSKEEVCFVDAMKRMGLVETV